MKFICILIIIITMSFSSILILSIYFIFTTLNLEVNAECINNEKWNPCGNDCVNTCSNLYITTPCNRDNTTNCIPKCECSSGYVRNSSGACVSPVNCPDKEIKCPPNKFFSSTANSCSIRKCSGLYYKGFTPQYCNPISIRGCICKRGFVLDDINYQGCVLERQCPKICCSKNREFQKNGIDCIKTCSHPHDIEYEPTSGSKPGCYCKRGFFEDGYGNCIPRSACPLNCNANEVEVPCVDPHQPTCEEPHPYFCGKFNCTRSCVCRPPFVRDKITGNCVDKSFCTSRCRDPNAVYVQEGTSCPKTCQNRYIEILCVNKTVEGCQCKSDYVFDDNRKRCILPNFCDCNQ